MRVVPYLLIACLSCGDDSEPRLDATTDDTMSDAGTCAIECDDGTFCNGVERCDPTDPGADERGCVAGSEPCPEVCDEDAGECTDCSDGDGDGVLSVACGGSDCDDANPDRYPGNTEVCDLLDLDEDCDPTTFGTRDGDGDGHTDAACCNEGNCGDDCDDGLASVHPSEAESCDGLDNDCDATVDEGVTTTYLLDADRDTFGVEGDSVQACAGVGFYTATIGGDCDDTTASTHPGATEICDGVNNDCDEATDEGATTTYYLDGDDDTWGVLADSIDACSASGDYTSTMPGDCDDSTSMRHPTRAETCDGLDNDCDDATWGPGEDDDGDDFPDASCGGTDCDDSEATVFPGATETCDGVDSDCDGAVEDFDGDRYSPIDAACTGGYPKTDCHDQNADVHPSSGYFGEPYCVAGAPCFSGGTWTCRLFVPPATCSSGIFVATPSWDYDCSGIEDAEPAWAGPCVDVFGGLCNPVICCPSPPPPVVCSDRGYSGTCSGGEGPVYSGAPPACGSSVTYRTCCCGPTCSGEDDVRNMACR